MKITAGTILACLVCVAASAKQPDVKRVRSRDYTCSDLQKLVKAEEALMVSGRLYVASDDVCEKFYHGDADTIAGYERAQDKFFCLVGLNCTRVQQ